MSKRNRGRNRETADGAIDVEEGVEENLDPQSELIQVRSELQRIIRLVAPEIEPAGTSGEMIEQIESIFISVIPRLGSEEDPLLGYSEVSRMCGRSPQTIRRWVLFDKLMKGEKERAGAPMKIRLSTVRAFFATGSINLGKYETKQKETVNVDSEVHGTSPGPS